MSYAELHRYNFSCESGFKYAQHVQQMKTKIDDHQTYFVLLSKKPLYLCKCISCTRWGILNNEHLVSLLKSVCRMLH